MSKLFERFKRPHPARSRSNKVPAVERPLIGSELFPDGPQSARDWVLPARRAVQAEYKSKGKTPEQLERIPDSSRNESFWEAYVDSLMVFEEYDRALEHVRHALKRFPRNAQLREMRVVIERRLR